MIRIYVYNDNEDGEFTAHFEDSKGFMTHFVGHKSYETIYRSIKENMELQGVSVFMVTKTWEISLVMWDRTGKATIIKKE